MFRLRACVALVVLGATAIGQGGLRAADDDTAGNRDQLLAQMLELSKDTKPGIYFDTVRIPKDLDRFRSLALAVGNLGRRDPDFRKKNGSTVATDLSGASVIINGKEETIVKIQQDLVLNETLNKAAQFQAEYQAAVKPGHAGPDSFNEKSMKSVDDRLKYFGGYTGGLEGEACGGGFSPTADPEDLMKGDTHFRPWFNIGHDVREMGVGIAFDAKPSPEDGRKYWRDCYLAGWPAGTPQPKDPASSARKESARRAPPPAKKNPPPPTKNASPPPPPKKVIPPPPKKEPPPPPTKNVTPPPPPKKQPPPPAKKEPPQQAPAPNKGS